MYRPKYLNENHVTIVKEILKNKTDKTKNDVKSKNTASIHENDEEGNEDSPPIDEEEIDDSMLKYRCGGLLQYVNSIYVEIAMLRRKIISKYGRFKF